MNIGFGDAEQLARVLALSLDQRRHVPEAFDRYTAVRRRAVQVATRRAARGMWLGTRTGHAGSLFRRTVITRILFRPPVRERLAPYFAMLTLPQEPTGIPITGWKGPSINRSDATS